MLRRQVARFSIVACPADHDALAFTCADHRAGSSSRSSTGDRATPKVPFIVAVLGPTSTRSYSISIPPRGRANVMSERTKAALLSYPRRAPILCQRSVSKSNGEGFSAP